jgi:hypothetical protein
MACIKPPVISMAGKVAIIGVTKPTFAAGPTADKAVVGGAVSDAEKAARTSAELSLEQASAATKAAQRELSALMRLSPRPEKDIARLKGAIRTLQQAQAAKREPSAVEQVLAARRAPADIEALLAPALANPKIPQSLRDELTPAMTKVQGVAAHAPGLALQHVAGLEIGRASAPGTGGTLWVNTVGGSGQVHGFAYEVVAASRFIDEARTPGNGGNPLQIRGGESDLIFGQKLPAGPGRRTVEADVLIVQPGGHKVAVDSKSYARSLPVSALQEQLDGVKHALSEGEVHEFHFASRGPISNGAKAAIEAADKELRTELAAKALGDNPTISQLQASTLDLSQPLICWHENLG